MDKEHIAVGDYYDVLDELAAVDTTKKRDDVDDKHRYHNNDNGETVGSAVVDVDCVRRLLAIVPVVKVAEIIILLFYVKRILREHSSCGLGHFRAIKVPVVQESHDTRLILNSEFCNIRDHCWILATLFNL